MIHAQIAAVKINEQIHAFFIKMSGRLTNSSD